MTLKIGIRYCG